ncbi:MULTISPECIES: response regulator transcription factor [Pantoea]|uniref:DNA-binding response regulator n=1 Tax=Pantoea endophytica TaxID=92488 RepID=A0ABX4SUZ5_9GAMM|nr:MULTISPECIES: response regulator transcription factor [Pantoea]PLR25705.1 hypothetical protein PZBJ_02560 [Pantoea endophytica]
MTKKIVIYDNNPVLIAGLKHLLTQQNFEVVGGTTDPDELIRAILLLSPDFVIMDPSLMKEEYLTKLCKVKSLLKGIQIVIFASSESVYHILRGHRLIWMAYLSKSQPLDELFDILRKPPQHRSLLIDIQHERSNDHFTSQAASLLRSLTGREMQVLREIGAGKTNKTIANEMSLSNKTISTYKRNIMDKFKTNDVREIMDIARRHGF